MTALKHINCFKLIIYVSALLAITMELRLHIATDNLPWNNNSYNTISIEIFIDAGSRYENESSNGSAHFLEHLAFKGTDKRTGEQLEMKVEDLGAHVLKENQNDICILSEILCNSILNSTVY